LVASALWHFLKNLTIPPNIKKIRFFTDACASQNRKTTIVSVLQHFVAVCAPQLVVEHYFPVRGHSFLPPDRVFGRMEKVFRKETNLLLPSEYYDIYRDFGTVCILGKDWVLGDYKSRAKNIFKTNLGFKISEVKAMRFEGNKIGIKTLYNGEFCWHNILKIAKRLSSFSVPTLELKCCVKPVKAEDVIKLLGAGGVDESKSDLKAFYESIKKLTLTCKANTE